MSHEIETAVFSRNMPAWHGLGNVINKELLTTSEAIELSGLDWSVSMKPLMYNGVHIFDKYLTIRNSDESVLGLVTSRYNVIQNSEVFDFGTSIIDSSDASIDTAGSLRNGQIIFVTIKFNNSIKIGRTKDENIDQYLVLTSGHDGKWAMRCYTTNIRVVCMNTLRWSMNTSSDHYSIGHYSNKNARLEDARKVIKLSFNYGTEIKYIANKMLKTKINSDQFDNLLQEVFEPVEAIEDQALFGKRCKKRNELILDNMLLYRHSDNLENIRNTAWGGFNSIIEYQNHHVNISNKETKFIKSLENNPIIDKAYNIFKELTLA